MNDRSMLELAAKAANMQVLGWSNACQALLITGPQVWDPLRDDGDAFRLAAELDIHIRFFRKHVDAHGDIHMIAVTREDFTTGNGKSIAARLAITRAAAEIGKTK